MKCGEVNKAGDLFVLRNEWGRNKLPTDWLPLEQQEFGDGAEVKAWMLEDSQTVRQTTCCAAVKAVGFTLDDIVAHQVLWRAFQK